MQKARAVRARVLAEEEHRIAVYQIIEHELVYFNTERLLQDDQSGLVAHVGDCRVDCCCRTVRLNSAYRYNALRLTKPDNRTQPTSDRASADDRLSLKTSRRTNMARSERSWHRSAFGGLADPAIRRP